MIQPKQLKWHIGYYPKFRLSYEKLEPEYRWRVKHVLNDLRFFPDPLSYAKIAQCPTLEVINNENYFALDVAKNGLGKREVKLLIFLDRSLHVIWPIFCRTEIKEKL